jgi:hypothetical protein
VNPARLSAERALDVCSECHLKTTEFPLPHAIKRYERGDFSYRPGEPLSAFVLMFDEAPGPAKHERFETASAVTTNVFGRENTGVIYGRIGASHQLGASLAALAAGTVRTVYSDYRPSFRVDRRSLFHHGFRVSVFPKGPRAAAALRVDLPVGTEQTAQEFA